MEPRYKPVDVRVYSNPDRFRHWNGKLRPIFAACYKKRDPDPGLCIVDDVDWEAGRIQLVSAGACRYFPDLEEVQVYDCASGAMIELQPYVRSKLPPIKPEQIDSRIRRETINLFITKILLDEFDVYTYPKTGEPLAEGTKLLENLGLDSLDLVEFSIALEEVLVNKNGKPCKEISTNELEAMHTIGDVIDYIEKHNLLFKSEI